MLGEHRVEVVGVHVADGPSADHVNLVNPVCGRPCHSIVPLVIGGALPAVSSALVSDYAHA